jgi:pimeloyl-ACP methyl ester carboxylesterase
MMEKVLRTECGEIHYWIETQAENKQMELVFLPGLAADHQVFARQMACFEGRYPLLVWDAPGHGASQPFQLNFSMREAAGWLEEILARENFRHPVLIGHGMGACLGQAYCQWHPQRLEGFLSLASVPLAKIYYSPMKLWMLKHRTVLYQLLPWSFLLRHGSEKAAWTPYGQAVVRTMLETWTGQQKEFAALMGFYFRIFSEASHTGLPFLVNCPAALVCGHQDRLGALQRRTRTWHKKSRIPLIWIEQAGHEAHLDQPEAVNEFLEKFVEKLLEYRLETAHDNRYE